MKYRALSVLGMLTLLTLLVLGFSGSSAVAEESENFRKVIAPAGVLTENSAVQLWHDYGTFALYRIEANTLQNLPLNTRRQINTLPQADMLQFEAYPFDTQTDGLQLPTGWQQDTVRGEALHLVQFVGPIKEDWLEQVRKTGAIPIHYINSNGYLVWSDERARASLDALATAGDFLQYSAPYQPYFKLGHTLRDRVETMTESDELMTVTVQMFAHSGKSETQNIIRRLAVTPLSGWQPILDYENITVQLHEKDIPTLAQRPDIYWVGERLEREKTDEIQDQILAGNTSGGGPTTPGYLPWLNGYGVSTNPADYPIVDVVDDGLGNGTVNSGDYTLHESGNIANPTRVEFVTSCHSVTSGEGTDGHGHINASIIGGYDPNEGGGFPFEDPNGYLRGLGVNPYARVGSTRIFAPGFDLSGCGNTDTGLIKHSQDQGALITSNSWGCSSCAGSYDDSSQAFDVGVRDADLTEAGNQEMTIIFSAGNSGSSAGTIGSPGNGKNMVAVGASENVRPTDEDGNWTDGCNIGPTGADNLNDVIDFSSRGPAPGNRVKPEIIAPGTHIQGTASTNGSYNGSGVCDQYRPSGQTTFASSSGTSHSAPAVSGVSSLYYYWLENTHQIATPSPAMIKAYLVGHPTYLTGVDANDTLPSNNQGYGMPNMGVAFDDTLRAFVDQDVIFDNSGEQWTWNGSVADPAKPVRIVMVYTDEAGAIGTSPQVNDLNLAATVNSTAYLGNVFSGQWSTTGGSADAANNYEAVFLPAGTSGDIDITVTGFNIAGDGVPNSGDGTDQDFALVCYNCTQGADFTMQATPLNQAICTPDDAIYDLSVGSILSYTTNVSLSTVNEPAGTTSSFSTNPVTVPDTSQLTIGNTGAAAFGTYQIDIVGMGATSTHTATVGLDLFTSTPSAVTLSTPSDGAVDVDLSPTLTWITTTQATEYYLQVASDSGFSTLVYTQTVTGDSHTLPISLSSISTYYWRVQPANLCGSGSFSSAYSFTTREIPPILVVDDDDNTPDVRSYLTDALDALGEDYDVWDSTADPTALQLQPYDMVLWTSGDNFSAGPSSAGESALAAWLDNGNCLFIASQDYRFNAGSVTPFMDTYLGIDTIGSDTGNYTAVDGQGVVFGALPDYTLDYGTPDLEEYGDTPTADADAEQAFIGTNGQNAAVLKDSGVYRTTFFGFPFAALPTATARQDVLLATLNWCGAQITTGTIAGTVTDANSSDPIANGIITADDGAAQYAAVTQLDGTYTLPVPSGTYTVTAAAANYVPETIPNVNVVTDTITADFVLQGSMLSYTPSDIVEEVELGTILTRTVTITNVGPLTTTFNLTDYELSSPIPMLPTTNVPAATCPADSFGYTCIDSNEAGGPTFDWIDISGTGTDMNLGDDNHFFPINLPFDFDFYGTAYNQVAVGSNGIVYFEDTYLGLSNTAIPSTNSYGIDPFIAVYWDDLNPSSAGAVYYEIQGTAPNRMLIVQFDGVPNFGTSNNVTAQAILYESSNHILVQYLDPSSEAGGEATTGIQGNSTTGLEYSYDTAALTSNLAVCYQSPGSTAMCGELSQNWIHQTPVTGTLAPGQTTTVDVGLDARTLDYPGVYEGAMVFGDQTAVPTPALPVTMTVFCNVTGTAPTVGMSTSGDDVVLSWDDMSSAHYDLYWSTEAFFSIDSSTWQTDTVDLTYTHTAAMGSSSQYFYHVMPSYTCGSGYQQGTASTQMGAIRFSITPGD